MKHWPAFVVGVVLLLLPPFIGFGGIWFFLPVWLWLTLSTLGQSRVSPIWFSLGLMAEIISPNPNGTAFVSWIFFLFLWNLWLTHFTGSEHFLARLLNGIVSAGLFTFVVGLRTFFLIDEMTLNFFIVLLIFWLVYSLSWCLYVFFRQRARFS